MSNELSNLANAGLAGVAITTIIALVYIVKVVLKLVANHINENTKATQELKDVIGELKDYLMMRNGKR